MSAEGAGFCPSCGTKRAAGSRFCANCGFEFEAAAVPEPAKGEEPEGLDSLPPPPPPRPTGGIGRWTGKQWALAGGGAAVILGGILAIVLIAGGDEEVPLQPVTEPIPAAGPATGVSPSPLLRSDSPEVVAAAARIGCTEIEENPDQTTFHEEPYAQGVNGVPAIGGNHTPAALPPDMKLYSEQPPEETAVHNLEHGYVIVYLSPQWENGLDDPDIIGELVSLVESETEVLLAAYESLAEPVYLTAWGARRACSPPPDADPDDVVLVARAFIDEWKNGPYAPEPAAA